VEAIVLAGGLGTRLRSVISDLPKPMAPVNDRPFLSYILDFLKESGVEKAILAVGYKAKTIQDFFQSDYKGLSITYSLEEEPLGTGGAILKALDQTQTSNILIINGDTFFKIPIKELYQFHLLKNAALSLAARLMNQSSRYGSIALGADHQIIGFAEKSSDSTPLINGGVYIVQKEFLIDLDFPQKFSFERDFLEKHYRNGLFYGLPFDAPFIDIGIPEDYIRVQSQLPYWV